MQSTAFAILAGGGIVMIALSLMMYFKAKSPLIKNQAAAIAMWGGFGIAASFVVASVNIDWAIAYAIIVVAVWFAYPDITRYQHLSREAKELSHIRYYGVPVAEEDKGAEAFGFLLRGMGIIAIALIAAALIVIL